jgi:hypothetical protein
MSVIVATASAAEADQDQPRVPVARAAAPAAATDRVQAAVRALLAATNDLGEYAVAQELDQARKREVAEYLGVLAEGLDRLNTLIGAASDQADQFTGSADAIAEVEEALSGAHTTLTDLADELHPISHFGR